MMNPQMSPIAQLMGDMGGNGMDMGGGMDLSPIVYAMKAKKASPQGGAMSALDRERIKRAMAWDRINNPGKYGIQEAPRPAQSVPQQIGQTAAGQQPDGWLARLYAQVTGQR